MGKERREGDQDFDAALIYFIDVLGGMCTAPTATNSQEWGLSVQPTQCSAVHPQDSRQIVRTNHRLGSGHVPACRVVCLKPCLADDFTEGTSELGRYLSGLSESRDGLCVNDTPVWHATLTLEPECAGPTRRRQGVLHMASK